MFEWELQGCPCNSADFLTLLAFDALPIFGQSPDTDTTSQSGCKVWLAC